MTTSHTADEMRAMLETGAAAADSHYQRAAIHLLTFTNLIGRADLAVHVETDIVVLDGREVPAAWIRDWTALGREVFPLCTANGISQIVWSPLAQGILTGKYRPGQPLPADSRFANETMNASMDIVFSDAALEAVQRLVPIAEDAGVTLPALALAWVLRRGELASAIIGASRPEQVHANVAASGVGLGDDVLDAIDVALDDVPVKGQTLAVFATEGVTHRRT